MTIGILTLAFLAAAVLLLRRQPPASPDPVEDPEALAEAEDEVRDLPAAADPDEGWVGDDWGPGAGPGGRR